MNIKRNFLGEMMDLFDKYNVKRIYSCTSGYDKTSYVEFNDPNVDDIIFDDVINKQELCFAFNDNNMKLRGTK